MQPFRTQGNQKLNTPLWGGEESPTDLKKKCVLSCLSKMCCHNHPHSLKFCQEQLAGVSPIYLFGGLLLVKNGQTWVLTSLTQEPIELQHAWEAKLWALRSTGPSGVHCSAIEQESASTRFQTRQTESLIAGQLSAWCALAITASVHKSTSYTITSKNKFSAPPSKQVYSLSLLFSIYVHCFPLWRFLSLKSPFEYLGEKVFPSASWNTIFLMFQFFIWTFLKNQFS